MAVHGWNRGSESRPPPSTPPRPSRFPAQSPRPRGFRSSASAPRPAASRPSASCWPICRPTPAWPSCWSSTSTPSTRACWATCWRRRRAMPVVEATQGLAVAPDHVYVIPPNTTLTIAGGVLQLAPRRDGARRTCRSTSFFASLAEDGARRRDRRRPVGQRLGRHPRPRGDQGRGRHHLRPGRSLRQVRRHAAQRGRAAAASTSSCRRRRSPAS